MKKAAGILRRLFHFKRAQLVVTLKAKMRNQFLTLDMSQRVLQLHRLNEQIMLRIQTLRRHRRLEEEAQPLLNADPAQIFAPLRQVRQQHQIQRNRGCKDRIATQKIHLNLHWVTEPSEDIYVVPTLFIITTWRVIVN